MTRKTALPALFARLTSKYSIYLVLAAMLVVCSLLSDAFFSAKNLSNISRQISITTIISFGMTMLIIAGMIDLAAGSVMALAGLAPAGNRANGSYEIEYESLNSGGVSYSTNLVINTDADQIIVAITVAI